MYAFHYEKWKKVFPESKLLFTDTDSLCYMVNKNPYKEMKGMTHEFDFSDYPKDHYLYDQTNMKVLGLMKDECRGLSMFAFIGHRAKLYAIKKYKYNEKENEIVICEDLKGKGLTETVRRNQLSYDSYLSCLMSGKEKSVKQNSIVSDHHRLYSCTTSKIGLSAADDKRWICNDGISTLAHGHYKTRDNQNVNSNLYSL